MAEIPDGLETTLADALKKRSPEILSFFSTTHEISTKPDDSIVTESDKRVEEMLKEDLSGLLRGSYFLGEESADDAVKNHKKIFEHEYIWSIDPIDGTVNFANGVPMFATSVGLLKRQQDGKYKPVVGATLFPAVGELVYTLGDKVYLANLNIGTCSEVEKATENEKIKKLVMLSSSFHDKYKLLCKENDVASRAVGCTVANLTYIALGRSIGTLTNSHIWDFAGSLAIANKKGINLYKYSDGTIKEDLGIDDFVIGNPKNNWRLNEPYLVCLPENVELLRKVIVPK